MDARTLTALRGSIEKWEKIVAGTETDRGTENCPLCHEFYWGGCVGCPVMKKTTLAGCQGTPHEDSVVERTGTEKYKWLAQAELDFLRSLLPEQEKK